MQTIPEALAIAVRHHQAGRLHAAHHIYEQILAVAPDQPDALHLLGVVAFQTGKHEMAIRYIGRAVQLQGNAAIYHNNLGEAYRAAGRIPEAVACYRRAVELQPDYAEAHNNLGVALTRQGKLDEAVASCRRALALRPEYVDAHNNAGNALKEQGKPEEALASYRRALALDPNYAMTHGNLGNLLREQGKLDEAVAASRRALALKPDYVEAYNNLGNALSDQGKQEEAIACYRQALALKPDYAAAHSNLGVALQKRGKEDEALACYRQALTADPNMVVAQCNLGNVLRDQGKLQEAIACYRRALELQPDYAEAHNNLGLALKEQGEWEAAVACYRRALILRPDFAEVHSNLGLALQAQGNLEAAVACYRRAIELRPGFAGAHYNLGVALEESGDLQGAADSLRAALERDSRFALAHAKLAELLGRDLPEDDLATQRGLLEAEGLSDNQRLSLHFGLASVMDARGRYVEAAEHLSRGNALQLTEWRKRGQQYNPREEAARVERMISACTPDFFQRARGFGLESELPVFVVGLPRSGTTLIEQILAGHSQVFGAGETTLARDTLAALFGPAIDPDGGFRGLEREAAQSMASQHLQKLRSWNGKATRIVDKMPDNYLHLGLMACLFPQAKFIHCRRDLRDVAVSCWMTHFRELRWANDPRHIASRFHDYQRLMEHWRKVLPVPLLEVDYEDVVADLEGASRRLVSWCGLEWEPTCLEFHRLKRPVRTASAVQVRQPIYGTSVGRWKHYEQALDSLFTAIRQCIGQFPTVQ